MTTEVFKGKRKFRRGKRYIDCDMLDAKLRRTDRHELMQFANNDVIEVINCDEPESTVVNPAEIIVFHDGILIWMANGSCCFCDKFEFSSEEQMLAPAA